MSITLTPAAADHVKRFLGDNAAGKALKIGIRASGCSGYMYDLDFVDAIGSDDLVFEDHGVKLVVDRKNLPFLAGTQLDYRREGLNEGFAFHNPNATSQCGCGESFGV
jgi:iron-sulfur cluster assembly protein